MAINTGWLSGLGVVGALADLAAHADKVKSVKEQMADVLTPELQVEQLKKIDAAKTLGMPADTVILADPAFVASEIAKKNPELVTKYKAIEAEAKAGKRLSPSTAACYVELSTNYVFYQKAALYGTRVFTFFTLRDFRAGKPMPKVFKGQVQHNASAFPADKVEKLEASNAALVDAYTDNFGKWVELKYKSAG